VADVVRAAIYLCEQYHTPFSSELQAPQLLQREHFSCVRALSHHSDCYTRCGTLDAIDATPELHARHTDAPAPSHESRSYPHHGDGRQRGGHAHF
jgi:hypothetical protein